MIKGFFLRLASASLLCCFGWGVHGYTQTAGVERPAEMSGYLLVPNAKLSQDFDAGFSLYAAAWPLLESYPGPRFQSGLFGTWMHPYYDQKPTERLYSDIEGGLGWWRDTRFATPTPKFIMGGVALNFVEWANGPGAGKGRDWQQPKGKYAVAQLSPWVLWPPDGLNLKQGTCGELFGYGYLPLPLTTPKPTTAGQSVPTGNQCWTLFLNTANFKGPVTFFTPYFWSQVTVERPELAGMFLDARPSAANRALQMETQYIPAVTARDASGQIYARVARTLFPENLPGKSIVVHRITSYTKAALWDSVATWFAGGPASSGQIDAASAAVHQFPGDGGATWRIFETDTPRDQRPPVDWRSWATPTAFDEHTFGYRWDETKVGRTKIGDQTCVVLPEYYRLNAEASGKETWSVVEPGQLPKLPSLAWTEVPPPSVDAPEPYVTPAEPDSCWKNPGPVAGPYRAYPGDGSEVTYYWYRFADQPALLNADLSDEQREQLQRRVELLHRHWTKERQYLPPPQVGTLAELDPALVVIPPTGLEIGYVPIVTEQGKRRAGG
jgi:hypothetical protein